MKSLVVEKKYLGCCLESWILRNWDDTVVFITFMKLYVCMRNVEHTSSFCVNLEKFVFRVACYG